MKLPGFRFVEGRGKSGSDDRECPAIEDPTTVVAGEIEVFGRG
jgi:hypothetical protein